jgi:hypothetical protein
MQKFGYSVAQADRRVQTMRAVFPSATIHWNADSIRRVPDLPDPADRHVVAAAIKARADAIVTLNLRDFPQHKLKKLGLLVQSPDDFLVGLYNLSEHRMNRVIEAQKSVSQASGLDHLARLRHTAPRFVELVSGAK